MIKNNARIAGVAERMEFHQASASALPFADETFDLAVSNLVFHEVSQVEFVKTCDEPFIPRQLNLPFMVGKIGILYGIK
jgi:hypothetical protein